MHRRPVPRLGGLAIFFAIIVPALAFLPLEGSYRGILLGAAIATVVGLPTTPGACRGGQAEGPVRGGGRRGRRSGWRSTASRSRSSAMHDAARLAGRGRERRLDRGAHEHGQLRRRHGRAGGGDLRDRRRHVRRHRALAREARGGRALGDRRRDVLRLPAPQLLPGADLHGRLGRDAARVHAGRGRRSRACSRRRRPSPCSSRCSRSRSRSSTRRSWSRSGSSTACRSGRPTPGTSTTASRTSASRSAAPSCTSGGGARSSPAPLSRRGSCPSGRTASGTCGRRSPWVRHRPRRARGICLHRDRARDPQAASAYGSGRVWRREADAQARAQDRVSRWARRRHDEAGAPPDPASTGSRRGCS